MQEVHAHMSVLSRQRHHPVAGAHQAADDSEVHMRVEAEPCSGSGPSTAGDSGEAQPVAPLAVGDSGHATRPRTRRARAAANTDIEATQQEVTNHAAPRCMQPDTNEAEPTSLQPDTNEAEPTSTQPDINHAEPTSLQPTPNSLAPPQANELVHKRANQKRMRAPATKAVGRAKSTRAKRRS